MDQISRSEFLSSSNDSCIIRPEAPSFFPSSTGSSNPFLEGLLSNTIQDDNNEYIWDVKTSHLVERARESSSNVNQTQSATRPRLINRPLSAAEQRSATRQRSSSQPPSTYQPMSTSQPPSPLAQIKRLLPPRVIQRLRAVEEHLEIVEDLTTFIAEAQDALHRQNSVLEIMRCPISFDHELHRCRSALRGSILYNNTSTMESFLQVAHSAAYTALPKTVVGIFAWTVEDMQPGRYLFIAAITTPHVDNPRPRLWVFDPNLHAPLRTIFNVQTFRSYYGGELSEPAGVANPQRELVRRALRDSNLIATVCGMDPEHPDPTLPSRPNPFNITRGVAVYVWLTGLMESDGDMERLWPFQKVDEFLNL